MNASGLNVVGRGCALVAIAGLGMLSVAPIASAQGSDDQYEITVKMEMAGMGMPPITQQSCVKRGANDADFVPRQDNCRVSDTTRTGARMTFKIACSGTNPMFGTGDFTFGGTGYNGKIRMTGKMEGQDIEMTQTIDGRRIGGCTAR